MNNIEVLGVIDYIKSLWPEWKPEDDLERLWINELKKYDDSVLRKAITNLKVTKDGGFKEPKIHKVKELANPLQAKIQKEQTIALPPMVGFYIQRIHLDGRITQTPYLINNKATKRPHDRETIPPWDVISRVAEYVKTRHESLYSAKSFQIIRGDENSTVGFGFVNSCDETVPIYV